MKKRLLSLVLCVACLLTLFGFPLSASAQATLPDSVTIHAKAAMVVYLGTDMSRDTLIYELNADEHYAPSGLVRIAVGLYALQVLEERQMDMTVATGSYSGTDELLIHDYWLPTVNMEIGDTWTVEDLLHVVLMQTAADALITLVTTLCGSESVFVDGMNAMLETVGCTDTHYTNVFGLDDTEQYTSARDTYRLLRYAAVNYPTLIDFLSIDEYTVHPKVGEVDSWPTTNRLLRADTDDYYAPLVYGRTGYTESIGQSCASVARDDGQEFMTVVIGCVPDAQSVESGEDDSDTVALNDTKTLFRWVYNAYSYAQVFSKGQPVSRMSVSLAWNTDSVALVAQSDLGCMLPDGTDVNSLRYDIALLDEQLTAPVEKGQVCGTVTVYAGDQQVGQATLITADAVARSQLLAMLDSVWRVLSNPIMLAVWALLLLALVMYIIISVVHNRHRRRNRQKRVKRYK